MKRKTARFTVAIFLFAAFISLASCSFAPTVNQQCYTCIDFNKDGFCDKCSKVVEAQKPPHVECIDEDENGFCDECNKEMPAEDPPHVECFDEDENGFCDECGKEMPLEKPPHVECADNDGNGLCDSCGASLYVEESLSLIEDGNLKFGVIVGNSAGGDARKKLDELVGSFEKLGYTLEVFDDNESETPYDVEVLIGTVVGRGAEYEIDGRNYGYEGYAVRFIDNKVIIVGANASKLCLAIDYFVSNVLGINESTVNLKNASFQKSEELEEYYTDYNISSVSVGGREISDYSIAYDSDSAICHTLAESIRETLFRYAGYNLKVVEIGNVCGNYISISNTERTGGLGFTVTVNGENLEIVSEYDNKIESALARYLRKNIAFGEGAVELGEYSFNTRDITYEEFGAVGDGETDDYEAIKMAHYYAGLYNHTVVASNDATYYIGPTEKVIYIRTNVVWGTATFIIDDRNIHYDDAERNVSLFHVAPGLSSVTFTPENCELIRRINENGGIKASEITKLDLGLGFRAKLDVYDSNHMVYIRTGGSYNDGNEQRELVMVDEYGNIDESTPFLLDYAAITKIVARPVDEEPLTIDGGIFITRAMQEGGSHNYYARNLVISRSRTTLKNFTHQVREEQEEGCPYSGFLSIQNCSDITVENCSFMSHKTYSIVNHLGNKVNMGSYDISINHSNNILFKNCTQPNFFESELARLPYFSTERWGIMGSNYSKNIRYENCRLSRLDAHCGVYNASLKNCEVVYISVVGGGTLTVEDTIIYENHAIQLRGDYGSTWNGDIYIKNVELVNIEDAVLFNMGWSNHYYGYETSMPCNIYIEGFSVYRGSSITIAPERFIEKGDVSLQIHNGEKNENPMKATERIVITDSEIEFIIPDNDFFKSTELIIQSYQN